MSCYWQKPMGPNWSNGWGRLGGCGAEGPTTQVALPAHLEGKREAERVSTHSYLQKRKHTQSACQPSCNSSTTWDSPVMQNWMMGTYIHNIRDWQLEAASFSFEGGPTWLPSATVTSTSLWAFLVQRGRDWHLDKELRQPPVNWPLYRGGCITEVDCNALVLQCVC